MAEAHQQRQSADGSAVAKSVFSLGDTVYNWFVCAMGNAPWLDDEGNRATMKFRLDGSTTWTIHRLRFGSSLLLLIIGCIMSGAAARFGLFPTTYDLYKPARLVYDTGIANGVLIDRHHQAKNLYSAAYSYTIQSPDGTIQRFIQDEYIDADTYYRLQRSGMPIKVRYSLSDPVIARMADNAYVPWIMLFLREVFGLIFFIVGLWLVFCAIGAWVIIVRRWPESPTEVAQREQAFFLLEQLGYIRITYQSLWIRLFYELRKHPQAAPYIVYRDGELYLSLNFIQDTKDRKQAQAYIDWLNAGLKPDVWSSVWLSQQLEVWNTD